MRWDRDRDVTDTMLKPGELQHVPTTNQLGSDGSM